MFVQYRVPENFNGLSMVFMHGAGQNGGMYETTPDGRPGWIFFFLQRGFAVYNVDWPCMGRSAFVAECPSISGTDVINAGVQLLDRIQTPTILLSWSTSGIFVTGMTDPPV
jgi:alpha-beta hydrolase superfamily lysophospholipase